MVPIKAFWFMAAVLVSLVVAIVAGVISIATGKTVLQALLYAGATFGGCMTLCLLTISTLHFV